MRHVLLAIAVSLLPRMLSADPLTFERLTTADAEQLIANNQGYGGFSWDGGWFLYRGDVYSPPGSIGSYGIVNNFGESPLGFGARSEFDFMGVSIAQWGFNAPTAVRIRAYDRANSLVGDTGELTIGPTFSAFATNFRDVTRIEFTGGQFFALDNLAVSQPAPVPEPATLTLVGVGLVAAGWRARGRRSR